ncbi:preprotein translocase subunit SecY [Pseudothermotoga thermarum]|uniref:Protein translocase subunit SecY n=1 Tax=Pseudothermotoga thermarum DSM 5069 TaxID=688269 RepID=F7YY04_9THEM|nr:preprotein translocase subunit SecY [Pseudothermotoga thermarum]AEH50809.1 protein translocase subunit secY/sec61 alpha [Pseudothermotoga thermarum DSM 5069]
MWQALKNAFKIKELRDRILFTIAALIVFRLGIYIPIPGINIIAWAEAFKRFGEGAIGGIISFYDVFTGGALENFSIFAMSVTPYINASIVLQLLSSVIPSLREMLREGEEGRKKFARYTRNLTVILGAFQSFVVSFSLVRQSPDIVAYGLHPMVFVMVATITMLSGTMFLLWLGDRITERGIGNGISIIIFAGIVARYPNYFGRILLGRLDLFGWIFLITIALVTVAGIIYVQQAERRISIQYATRITGRRVYGGASTYIPVKVNQAGVIPIIFASAIVMIPAAIAQMTGWTALQKIFGATSPFYVILYGLLVFFFTYFYSVIVFDPHEVAENIKKYGGFIPGIRPGKPTEEYIQKIVNKVTFMGAVFLVIIALLPHFVQAVSKVDIVIGGTSTLIAVGVALDVVQQMEAHMIMRHYEGFIKKGKI